MLGKKNPEAIVAMAVPEFEKMASREFVRRCPNLCARVEADVYAQVYGLLDVLGAADVAEQVAHLRKTGLSLEKIKAMDQAGLLQKPITQKEIEAKKAQEKRDTEEKARYERDIAMKMEILEGLKTAHGSPIAAMPADANYNPNSLVSDARKRAMEAKLKEDGKVI